MNYMLKLNGTPMSVGNPSSNPKSDSRDDLFTWAKATFTLAMANRDLDDITSVTVEKDTFGYKTQRSRNKSLLKRENLFTFTKVELLCIR